MLPATSHTGPKGLVNLAAVLTDLFLALCEVGRSLCNRSFTILVSWWTQRKQWPWFLAWQIW